MIHFWLLQISACLGCWLLYFYGCICFTLKVLLWLFGDFSYPDINSLSCQLLSYVGLQVLVVSWMRFFYSEGFWGGITHFINDRLTE